MPSLNIHTHAFVPLSFVSSRFDRLRYVEIKHGRISMLAVAGHLTQQNFRLPGMLSNSADISFADMPNGLAALSKIPAIGIFQIIAFIGFLEIGVMKQKEGSFPGDMTLGGEPYAWTKFSDEVKEQKKVRQTQMTLSSAVERQLALIRLSLLADKIETQPKVCEYRSCRLY